MPRPLTVLQMLPALESGGVERGTLEVARHLVAHGHRSLVLSAGGRLVETLAREGSEHIAWPVGRKSLLALRFVRPLRRLLAERQVDVLHVRSRLPGWIAYLAWRGMAAATRPHLVTTVHGLYTPGAYSSVMMRGERVIAVSETVREYIRANYPWVDPDVIRVIPRGVDAAQFPHGYQPDAAWRERWQSAFPELAGKFVITLPGRLTRLKGHEDFVELVRRLHSRGLPVHGLIVGAIDPQRQGYARQLQHRVATLRLPVTFTGQRDDMKDIYAVSDAVLSLSTRPESFGRTVLEALRLGVPVLGWAHGGVGEILDAVYPDGAVAKGDIGALEKKLLALIRHPARVPASNAFPLDAMLARTLDLYQELVLPHE